MKKLTIALIVFLGLIIIPVWPANAVLIDLNDFFADPTVTVAADGFTATIAEDAFFSPVLLANDPGLGDPNVIFPAPGSLLYFEYDFVEPLGNDDEFGAFILDATTGLSVGSVFEFFIQDTSSGTVSFDLSSLTGSTLGLQFELTALTGDSIFDSTVTVSNVRLVTAVPEPTTILLLATGLFGLFGLKRRKFRS